MVSIIRLNTDVSMGHDGYPPRAPDSTPNTSVYVNGILAACVGSHYPNHNKSHGSNHDGIALTGGHNVFFCGAEAHITGDPISCGDHAGPGSPDCHIG